LDAYRAIGAALPGLLTPQGHAVIELGQGQDGAVRAIFEGVGLDVSGVVSDLGGIPRALVASLQRS
jgi:release factor glutamine methyltransferase